MPPLLFAMAIRDRPTSETERALKENTPRHRLVTVAGLPVDEARNELVRKVLALTPKPEVVVWIDADSFRFANAISSLLGVLGQFPDVGVVTAFDGYRDAFRPPLVWKRIGGDATFVRPGEDCPQGHVLQIGTAGFQMVAMRRSVLERIGVDPFSVTDVQDGEDTAFFIRCQAYGVISACHTGVPVAHVGDDGYAYLPGGPRFAILGNDLVAVPTAPVEPQARKRTRDYGPAVNERLDSIAASLARTA